MDIYSYLNSPDVAEHCRKLNHSFNALESAFIVNDCRSVNIEEKHRLYSEIMNTMPDVTIRKHLYDEDNDPSFYNHLRKEIEREKSLLFRFIYGENNAVYTFRFYDPEGEDSIRDDEIYSSYNNAMAAAKKHQKKSERRYIYLITMKILNQEDRLICILNNDLDICFIQTASEPLLNQFWVYIPTPFQKGDLLCGVGGSFAYPVLESSRVMVLTDLAYWRRKRDSEPNEYIKTGADSSDMTAYGYWLDGRGYIYDECIHAYHNLQYYRGEIHPRKCIRYSGYTKDLRLLKAISAYMKGKINVNMLLIANDAIRTERQWKELFPSWDYVDEEYEKAGIGDILKIRNIIKEHELKEE